MDLSERGASTSRHPWEIARARFFARVLRDHGVLHRGARVLDVGAGDGYFARTLVEESNEIDRVDTTLWDTNYTPDDVAALTAQGFTATTATPEGPFDVAVLLDVTEHVVDDRKFLDTVLAECGPHAHVLFSVPAWPSLWSSHDVALKHERRYAPRAARRLLDDVGLDVVEGGGVFHALIAPRLLEIARDRFRPNEEDGAHGVGTWTRGRLVTRAIATVLEAEGRASRALSRTLSARGVDVPGLSWWALAVRRSS